MSLWHRLLTRLGLRRDPASQQYALDEEFRNIITELARQEQRPEEDIHADLLAAALAQRHTSQDVWSRWRSLSRREQEVTALTCLGYTNNEIASKLNISVETVKTHLRNILVKFGLHGKGELRIILSDWDFSGWDKTSHI